MSNMRNLVFITLFTLISCTTTKIVEVPVETVRMEYTNKISYDSIYIHDSIDRSIVGDTVYINKWNTSYRYIYRTDTLIIRDSIPYIMTVESIKEIEVNKVYWYQYILVYLGLISVLYWIIKLLIDKYKND